MRLYTFRYCSINLLKENKHWHILLTLKHVECLFCIIVAHSAPQPAAKYTPQVFQYGTWHNMAHLVQVIDCFCFQLVNLCGFLFIGAYSSDMFLCYVGWLPYVCHMPCASLNFQDRAMCVCRLQDEACARPGADDRVFQAGRACCLQGSEVACVSPGAWRRQRFGESLDVQCSVYRHPRHFPQA